MKVYTKVRRREAIARGKEVVGVKWIDINKGDSTNEDYRSRLVAQQFHSKPGEGKEKVEDLFAATPPAKVLKLLLDRVASARSRRGAKRRCIMSINIKRAYFFAPARTDVYVELPPEDKTEEGWESSEEDDDDPPLSSSRGRPLVPGARGGRAPRASHP